MGVGKAKTETILKENCKSSLPSLIFCSNSSSVGSISSQPSGGGFLLLRTFGILLLKFLEKGTVYNMFVRIMLFRLHILEMHKLELLLKIIFSGRLACTRRQYIT